MSVATAKWEPKLCEPAQHVAEGPGFEIPPRNYRKRITRSRYVKSLANQPRRGQAAIFPPLCVIAMHVDQGRRFLRVNYAVYSPVQMDTVNSRIEAVDPFQLAVTQDVFRQRQT